MTLLSALFFVTLWLVTGQAFAVLPDEVLKDPALEARARHLSQDLRCLVCQNQSIDDSAAPLARDLRVIVRERLTKGDSDEQVVSFLVARYGNYVLLKPPLQTDTVLLWFGPAAFLLIAAGVSTFYFRTRRTPDGTDNTPLTEAERLQLAKLVKDI
ncbi:MAG: cytochrome c-type biogenesis protein [Aestuariivirga sp.]